MADTERPPKPLLALTQEEQQEPAPSHSPARGEGCKLKTGSSDPLPVVGAAALMAISFTLGCSWGSERLMLICNQHAPTCPQSTATLSILCYHLPLRSKGVRRWKRWSALITGIPSTLIGSEQDHRFNPHEPCLSRHCWDSSRARNTQCCQVEREEKCCLQPSAQGGAWAACVLGPTHKAPGAYSSLAVPTSLGNMLLLTGQASLNILCLILQNVK